MAIFGCVADDFTGAGDAAILFSKGRAAYPVI
mgnify:CR=1 FL=1